MSGVETAAVVYGLVTGTIDIVKVSVEIYHAVKDQSGIPEKLRKVSDKLPSLVEILHSAEAQYKAGQPDEQTWVKGGEDVRRCKEACQELQELLQRAYPKVDAGRVERFFKSTESVLSGRGKTAEQLLAEIHGYLKLLMDRRILTTTGLLEDIKKTVDELLSQSSLTQKNVNGPNIGRDQNNYNNSGPGPQVTGNGAIFNYQNTPDELNENFVQLKLQEWLDFPSIEDRRADISPAHRKTFDWVLKPLPSTAETPIYSNFAQWLRHGTGLYWIQGIMGSGKSTLMRYVAGHQLLKEHLGIWADRQPVTLASFYFWSKGDQLQRSLQGLYRTLLLHLVRNERALAHVAFPHWNLGNAKRDPTVGILREAMHKILQNPPLMQKYCIVIDGLDEYEENDSRLRTKLAIDILRLAELSNVKVVVTSRPEASFVECFASCPTMRLQDLTKHDITSFVKDEMHAISAQTLTKTNVQRLTEEIVSKARGVFIWVILAVENARDGLIHGETYLEVQKRVRELRDDLSALYKQVLTDRIQPEHRKAVARCFLMMRRYRAHVYWAPDSQLIDHGKRDWFTFRQTCPLPVYAIGKDVDGSCEYRKIAIYEPKEIEEQVVNLKNTFPRRSCGLVKDSWYGINLLHSSVYEFIDREENLALLKKEAGADFEVDVALAIGRVVHLVLEIHKTPGRPRDEQWAQNQRMAHLLEIVHCIEIARPFAGNAQDKLFGVLDTLLEKNDWAHRNLEIS